MFGHKARQFAEMARRQSYVEPFYEFTAEGLRTHKSYQAYRHSRAIRRMIEEYEAGVDRRKADLSRFRGYAYKAWRGRYEGVTTGCTCQSQAARSRLMTLDYWRHR